MRLPFSRQFPVRSVDLALLAGLVALAISTGCSNGTSVTLQATLGLETGSPSLTQGDGTTDGWGTDQYLTPAGSGFAMGIRSAKLTGPNSESYTIFDTSATPDSPWFLRLADNTTTTVFNNGDSLDNGTYDTLALQVVYYEVVIPVSGQPRRLRAYLTDFTEMLPSTPLDVLANDLLMSQDPFTVVPSSGTGDEFIGADATNVQWILPDDGSLCTSTTRSDCYGASNSLDPFPTTPYQFQPTLAFPGYGTSGTINLSLSDDIVVDSDTDAQYTITLNVGAYNIFFYDNTDANSTFDGLSSSSDGTVLGACSTPVTCPSGDAKKSADFWIGAPKIDVNIEPQ